MSDLIETIPIKTITVTPDLAAAPTLNVPLGAPPDGAPDVMGEEPPLVLPDVYRGELDAAGVRALFADLGALPQPVEVRLKAGAQARAQTPAQVGEVTLARAEALLLDGLVLGVQLIYRHEGETWLDTVLRRGDGYQVVRMAAMAPPAG